MRRLHGDSGQKNGEDRRMTGQMTIFDWMSSAQPEPDVGTYVTEHGANIPHIMRPSYIGRKVVYDCSTFSHRCYQVGILEKYIRRQDCDVMRSIIYTGKKQRILFDHWPGREIFECLPWNTYLERTASIGKH